MDRTFASMNPNRQRRPKSEENVEFNMFTVLCQALAIQNLFSENPCQIRFQHNTLRNAALRTYVYVDTSFSRQCIC
eukprot:5271526-Amphidinium_carterae.1